MPDQPRRTNSKTESNPRIPEPEAEHAHRRGSTSTSKPSQEIIGPKDKRWRKELRDALRDLRKHLGITQQDLAVRLGRAVVTVARWETSRPPSTVALYELAALADKHQLFELSCRFIDLAWASLVVRVVADPFQHPLPGMEAFPGQKSPGVNRYLATPAGDDLQVALILVLRNQRTPEIRRAWESLRKALVGALDSLIAEAETGEDMYLELSDIKDLRTRIIRIAEQSALKGQR